MTRMPRWLTLIGLLFLSTLPASAHLWRGCADDSPAASAVKTRGDVRAFVECAAQFLEAVGPEEARHTFHEEGVWKHGQIYVFTHGLAKSGRESMAFVYPPDPAREGLVWGETIDGFGTDLYYEIYRMMQVVDAGWIYYSILNPATGVASLKASYVIETDWDGHPAFIGAGIYEPDLPSTCRSEEVSAKGLGDDPSPEALAAVVRCVAMMLESGGYSALDQIEHDARWSDGVNYVFVMDSMGNQLATGNPVRVNGNALHEWRRAGRPDSFGGRDMVSMAGAFGEAYVYYDAFHPRTGAEQGKVGFLKRVVANGVPLIVGSGYFSPRDQSSARMSCADRRVTAGAVRSREQIQAFVQCAAEYAMEHGTAEARRAFNEEEVWKHRDIYVFVDEVQPSGEDALTYVFPPDPSREGSLWGTSIDGFGTDYYFELHRLLSVVDSGWIYYAFTNPATGIWQPKSSYVMEIDWNGARAAIGAGFYSTDLPGTCEPGVVNAASLEEDPHETALQAFVRCAALAVEASGLFGGRALETDPRWNHHSIYPFVIDEADGTVLFSSNPASFRVSGKLEELFDGRDMVEATATFGETFWYYLSTNPETGEVGAKTSFVKRVVAHGMSLLVGAGYYPPHHHDE